MDSAWNSNPYYQSYETNNVSGHSNGRAFNNSNASQHAQYRHRVSTSDIDLSSLNHLGNNVSLTPVESLTRPLQEAPWNIQSRNGLQLQAHQPPPSQSMLYGRSGPSMTAPTPDLAHTADTDMRHTQSKDRSEADSGYMSQCATTGGPLTEQHPSSTYSSDTKELLQDFHPNAQKLDVLVEDSIYRPRPPAPRSIASENLNVSRHERTSRKPSAGICPFAGCGREARNQSDAKKHAFTHERPFTCEAFGCTRKNGFATDNDLQRHRKTVHGLHPTVGNPVGYICKACVPIEGKQPKFWPRRDNFKAHIKRKHVEQDEDTLLSASKTNRPDDAVTAYDEQSHYNSRSRNTSQVDHNEGTEYQQHIGNASSPMLSRSVSQQNDFSDASLFQGAGFQENTLAGINSHQQDQYNAYYMNHNSADSLDMLSMEPYHAASTHLHPSSAAPSAKKRKLSDYDQSPVTQHHADYTFSPTHSTNNPQPLPPQSQSQQQQQPPQQVRPAAPHPSSAQGGEHQCKECGKYTKRECDLKKHIKRHTRPYGCTFANCRRRFGSRNDWKRHENGQHFLSEMWKCGRPRLADKGVCLRRPFHTLELMKRHLRGPEHKMTHDGEILEECRRYCLGREGHGHFWCGFCKALIEQPKEMTNAWENRFKHIGDHFDKDAMNIDDWYCIEENKPKRHITEAEHTAARRRAKTGCRGDDDGDLPEYIPELEHLSVQSGGHMDEFGMGGEGFGSKGKGGVNDDAEVENDCNNGDMHVMLC